MSGGVSANSGRGPTTQAQIASQVTSQQAKLNTVREAVVHDLDKKISSQESVIKNTNSLLNLENRAGVNKKLAVKLQSENKALQHELDTYKKQMRNLGHTIHTLSGEAEAAKSKVFKESTKNRPKIAKQQKIANKLSNKVSEVSEKRSELDKKITDIEKRIAEQSKEIEEQVGFGQSLNIILDKVKTTRSNLQDLRGCFADPEINKSVENQIKDLKNLEKQLEDKREKKGKLTNDDMKEVRNLGENSAKIEKEVIDKAKEDKLKPRREERVGSVIKNALPTIVAPPPLRRESAPGRLETSGREPTYASAQKAFDNLGRPAPLTTPPPLPQRAAPPTPPPKLVRANTPLKEQPTVASSESGPNVAATPQKPNLARAHMMNRVAANQQAFNKLGAVPSITTPPPVQRPAAPAPSIFISPSLPPSLTVGKSEIDGKEWKNAKLGEQLKELRGFLLTIRNPPDMSKILPTLNEVIENSSPEFVRLHFHKDEFIQGAMEKLAETVTKDLKAQMKEPLSAEDTMKLQVALSDSQVVAKFIASQTIELKSVQAKVFDVLGNQPINMKKRIESAFNELFINSAKTAELIEGQVEFLDKLTQALPKEERAEVEGYSNLMKSYLDNSRKIDARMQQIKNSKKTLEQKQEDLSELLSESPAFQKLSDANVGLFAEMEKFSGVLSRNSDRIEKWAKKNKKKLDPIVLRAGGQEIDPKTGKVTVLTALMTTPSNRYQQIRAAQEGLMGHFGKYLEKAPDEEKAVLKKMISDSVKVSDAVDYSLLRSMGKETSINSWTRKMNGIQGKVEKDKTLDKESADYKDLENVLNEMKEAIDKAEINFDEKTNRDDINNNLNNLYIRAQRAGKKLGLS